MALTGINAAVYLSSSTGAIAFTDEATTANVARTIYSTSALKRYWDPGTPVVVKRNDAIVSKTEYSLAYAGGQVRFKVAQPEGTIITVTGASIICSRFSDCKMWKLDIDIEMEDNTTFDSGGWKTFQPLLQGAAGSFERWFGNDWFLTRITAETPLLLVLYLDDIGVIKPRLECMANLTKDSVKSVVDKLTDEAVEFTVTGPVNWAE